MAPKKPKKPKKPRPRTTASNHVCLHYKAAMYPQYCVYYASDCSAKPPRPCAYSGPCNLTPGGSCTSTGPCLPITFFRARDKHVHAHTKNGTSAYFPPGDSPSTHGGAAITFSALVNLKLNPSGTRKCRVKLFRLRKPGDATLYIGIQVPDGAAPEAIDYAAIEFDEQCCRAKYNDRWYSVVLHRSTTHG